VNPVQNTVYISFSAEINVQTTENLIAVLANQANAGVEHVYLMLSTPGGAVMNGLNLYNVMRAMPFKITTHNVGNVDSIGNAVFLAGEERFACAHSTFMFHGVGYDVQNMRLEQKNLQESLDALLRDQERIGSILQERSSLNAAETVELFREARTKDATFALEKGLISDIRDVDIPAGTPIISLVFQR
jgi:ATP-dependent Clp protease, protease subunit